jgi:phage-related protein
MYELVLPALPLAVGFLLGTAIKQVVEYIYNVYFKVEQTVEKVFSTALMIRDSGILMVQESYETAVMLFRNILDGVLVPIVNATKELILLVRPVLEVVVVIMKTLIVVLQRVSELVLLIVETVSSILTSIFTTLHNFATNTTATVSSWTSWMYEGTSNSFFYTLLYIVGFYVLAQILILFTKRLVKKIK